MTYTLSFFIVAAAGIYLSGRYLYTIMNNTSHRGNKVFSKIEAPLLLLSDGTKENMSWKAYFWSLIKVNIIAVVLGGLILWITSNMSLTQVIHTLSSFITNTNLQHYTPETSLTLLGQMFVIMVMMFLSSASGIAVGFAFIRGLSGQPLGNFYKDMTRVLIRYLIPVAFGLGLLLVWQGVPQTLIASQTVHTINGQTQTLYLGPVAAFEAIKHLGTNGGGFFAAGSAVPFENPTLISNLINMVTMTLVPGGMLLAFGFNVRKQHGKKGWLESTPILIASFVFFMLAFVLLVYAEYRGNPLFAHLGLDSTMNFEGKEMRFGIVQSALFTTVSSAFTTGSVNSMLDSMTPLGGMVPMVLMMLNVVFGGSGVGLMNVMMYVFLTVFMCGLMIGRSPSYLGKKIESQEMKRVAMVIVIHPLLILGFTALAVMLMQGSGTHHSLSQALYEFTSAAANNGSGFEGLADNTVFWNLSTSFVMLVGRYVTMYLQLSIAGLMLKKQSMSESIGTLNTNTPLFTIALIVIIVLISALTFFPALILGPIAEAVSMGL
ncbi:potassium-transporting ATPase subunit A [Erysipelothrix sp. HDW6B]|uniref:potassium-transporting ATPase subunit KdpA n=1 Tax=Erysipelothrix sp. HDW6B TaxID=2714929 RepID=UPI00140E1E87|nr:potassium-transporting ATPase subunit KdpA [Erysipelothrix sp. HDW6B]QIK86894.1 potassium-transporting ATPase subunit A [Erysipelothrix sp. HDW6B]